MIKPGAEVLALELRHKEEATFFIVSWIWKYKQKMEKYQGGEHNHNDFHSGVSHHADYHNWKLELDDSKHHIVQTITGGHGEKNKAA